MAQTVAARSGDARLRSGLTKSLASKGEGPFGSMSLKGPL